jgi:hypothetical protein
VKTVATKKSVTSFINAIDDPQRRRECRDVVKLMRRVTGCRPVMWGDSIIGFDRYRYKRANGKEFESFRAGFSPRKTALTLYIMPGYSSHGSLLKKLGPHKNGKCCLYLRRLADVDADVLEALIRAGFEDMSECCPSD